MEKLRRIKHRRATRKHVAHHSTAAHHVTKKHRVLHHAKRHTVHARKMLAHLPWRKIGLWSAVGVVGLLMLAQSFYPGDRMPLFSRIDGVNVSWDKKPDAVAKLDAAYGKHTVAIYMTGDKKPVTSPKLSELNVSINNASRVDQVNYPWYLRIIPTSLFWAGLRAPDAPKATFGAKFQTYVDTALMPSCHQVPVNATLRANGEKLSVVDEIDGRLCEKNDVIASIKKIQPVLATETAVHVGAVVQKPDVTKNEATVVAKKLNEQVAQGIKLQVNGATIDIAAKDVVTWLDFAPHDDTIDVTVNSTRAGSWLTSNVASKVAVQPGISYITTRDFTELSRTNGANGQALDMPATVASIQQVVLGEIEQASASTKVLPPSEQYTRTYSPSDSGLSALLANYAHDHPGTFGASMIELDGKKRRTDYNGNTQFVTASTYKLFVAYSLMKQIDAGKRDWPSNEACFNKMISYSDNSCAESFLNSLGLSTVTKDIQAIGLSNSTFMKAGGPFTTANDLTLLLGMIATGQNFSSANQQRLVAAMKGNVYRNGIPAGVQGTVADKVGFLDGLLHDAAIVYGPHGTYVLAIMTDGSTWGTIADLAKQIDTLHAQ